MTKNRQRELIPNSTPSKKRCDDKPTTTDDDHDMEDVSSPNPPTDATSKSADEAPNDENSIKRYVCINSVITEATIRNMSNENLLKEIVSASKKIGTVVSFDSIKTLPKPAYSSNVRLNFVTS